MMQIPEQDLVFKLRSLGVRIEGEDAGIDSESLQAVLQGKRLGSPREVIMDDGAPAPAARKPAGPLASASPSAARVKNPLKPLRPRTIIQKVEPRIVTLPSSQPDRPAPTEAPPAAPILVAAQPPASRLPMPVAAAPSLSPARPLPPPASISAPVASA
ncbi:MAG TPA: hypothetical protein VI942_12985, partial [Thermoanaerobaculia bacterium]|nr:hypothetical protein [Thermoanaerobaculia bacterium]